MSVVETIRQDVFENSYCLCYIVVNEFFMPREELPPIIKPRRPGDPLIERPTPTTSELAKMARRAESERILKILTTAEPTPPAQEGSALRPPVYAKPSDKYSLDPFVAGIPNKDDKRSFGKRPSGGI